MFNILKIVLNFDILNVSLTKLLISCNLKQMEIGHIIRDIRKKKNLTIKEISASSGVAQSLISQIENDKANPSLSTLIAIAEALDVPIMTFFGGESKVNSPVVRADERTLIREQPNSEFFALTNDIIGDMEFLYCRYSPGGQSNTHVYTHKGAEALYLLKGTIEVELDGVKYILKEGDSIAFNSERPHLVRNIHDGESVAIAVNTPPTY